MSGTENGFAGHAIDRPHVAAVNRNHGDAEGQRLGSMLLSRVRSGSICVSACQRATRDDEQR